MQFLPQAAGSPWAVSLNLPWIWSSLIEISVKSLFAARFQNSSMLMTSGEGYCWETTMAMIRAMRINPSQLITPRDMRMRGGGSLPWGFCILGS